MRARSTTSLPCWAVWNEGSAGGRLGTGGGRGITRHDTGVFRASSVEGAGASSPERRFSSIVCRALGWREVNLGLGGTTVTGRDDAGQVVDLTSGIGRVPEVLEAKPDHVLILYGANDFAQSRPLGEPRLFRQGTFFWDYNTMIRGLLDGLEPEQISVSTVIPFGRGDAERAGS